MGHSRYWILTGMCVLISPKIELSNESFFTSLKENSDKPLSNELAVVSEIVSDWMI